ncbi:acyl-CoA reductase [Gluconacetobacter diazotrophicus]|uniref:Acyl-CoA reductase n=1 Tax=Gluconacetobacter diazotrophicus (strain ATCC 49037 / DSM 5601 / CCUG 37298 / CIP 103539 / LMG 7603 / PAl5) TaxID=272568 RepID=A9HRM9_GLUDA|nr:acyl-CoA reductase [Gluconacetobacter diazotrophicus]CAP56945.1 acyl-CoA reductase [Gluconacetobacter diazotrophicus PA1 5]
MPIVTIDESARSEWADAFDFSSRFAFFDEIVVEFLQELSHAILKNTEARQYPDLATFAYFCRRANLHALFQRYTDSAQRSGWGTAVHVAPANIPINFAFSLVFGLLAGNSNIVRMPSRHFPQNDLFVEIFDRIAGTPRFSSIADGTLLLRTSHGSKVFEAWIAEADSLIVWGGDATIAAFRTLIKKPRCVEIYFPDRKSSAVIDAAAYTMTSQDARRRLARNFFNDTYLVDQNACSSPSIVFWVGNPAPVTTARDCFWKTLDEELKNRDYRLEPTARIDKFLDLMAVTATFQRPVNLKTYSPDIWCVEERMPPRNLALRFGQFVDMDLPSVDGIATFLRSQEQTLTYFGVDPYVLQRALRGGRHTVDRIVPVGKALDINPFWDGKDILAQLSRRIDLVAPSRDMRDAASSVQPAIQA